MGKKMHNTDEVMKKLWLCLVRDFRENLGHDYASRPEALFQAGGIEELRAYKWPARSQVSPYLFKADYQLENLFKRYRFKDDVFTDSELEAAALEKFQATQLRIATPFVVTPLVFKWLQRARTICAGILGEYSLEEHYSFCRFGKRSCVGTPYQHSYLDVKLGKPITGSKEHLRWFKQYLRTDDVLSRVVSKSTPTKGDANYRECDTLTLALVPKSYKAKRTILANTLAGSFATLGLGKVIQDRLCKRGLDIRRLQNKHGVLARVNSRTRTLATADLSAASDSITRELLRMLLPFKWYRAVMLGHLPNISYEGGVSRMSSVITMGMGHTFPLQTLIFYSLLCAIAELTGGSTKSISVYGDDLIYPSRLHRYVRTLFPMVHLHLNGDKTYVVDHFRESCGSDYYRGSDVRPFQPEGEYELLDRQHYAVFLYKLLNGLKRRWDEVEIPRAFDFLLSQLCFHCGVVYQVPPSFPDGSGLKVQIPSKSYFYSEVAYAASTQTWVFKYLHVCPDNRIVEDVEPYYWEWLRVHESGCEHSSPWDLEVDKPMLRWIKNKRSTKHLRSKISGRRLRDLMAVCSSKTRYLLRCQEGSTSSWA